MELAVAVVSVVAPLAPGIKDWLDSMALRNRAAARAEIIRARSAGQADSSEPTASEEGDAASE